MNQSVESDSQKELNRPEDTGLPILMQKRPFVGYAALVLLIGGLGYAPWVLESYGCFPSSIVMIFVLIGGASPTLASVFVSAVMYGRDGPAHVFSGFKRGRNRPFWILFAAILPFIMFFSAVGLYVISGTAYNLAAVNIFLFFPLLVQNFLMNMWEEIGWRGFALPVLQEKHGALQSSLAIGVIWALWHWPHFLVADSQMLSIYGSFPMFFADTLVTSIVYTIIYNSSNGSLLAVSLYHGGMNALGGLLILSTGVPIPSIFTMAVNLAIVTIAIIIWGHESISSQGQVDFEAIEKRI